jgi:preprotein translocase subunit SecB
MSVSGVKSSFCFESYKIDTLKLTAAQNVELLSFKGAIPEDEWHVSISIRIPSFFKTKNAYVGGLHMSLMLLTQEGKAKLESGGEITDEDRLLFVEGGIAGLFTVDKGKFDKGTEKGLVRIQIPALLLPYLRGTITSLLANAGYGTVILPLINIHALAEEQLQGTEIKVID